MLLNGPVNPNAAQPPKVLPRRARPLHQPTINSRHDGTKPTGGTIGAVAGIRKSLLRSKVEPGHVFDARVQTSIDRKESTAPRYPPRVRRWLRIVKKAQTASGSPLCPTPMVDRFGLMPACIRFQAGRMLLSAYVSEESPFAVKSSGTAALSSGNRRDPFCWNGRRCGSQCLPVFALIVVLRRFSTCSTRRGAEAQQDSAEQDTEQAGAEVVHRPAANPLSGAYREVERFPTLRGPECDPVGLRPSRRELRARLSQLYWHSGLAAWRRSPALRPSSRRTRGSNASNRRARKSCSPPEAQPWPNALCSTSQDSRRTSCDQKNTPVFHQKQCDSDVNI